MENIRSAIGQLEKIRKVPQFLYFESIGLRGSYTVRHEVLKFTAFAKGIKEIDFILNSGGGSPHDAYRIIRVLRNAFETVNIIVPYWAKSAATLLALGGNRIVMDEMGELGPLDVQIHKLREDSPDYAKESALIDEHSLRLIEIRSKVLFEAMFEDMYASKSIPINRNELAKMLLDYISEFYRPLLNQINPYKLGDNKRKLDIAEQYARRIFRLFNPQIARDRIDYLIDYMINGCPDHEYALDYELISQLLPIVERSTCYGKEYSTRLSQLADLLIQANGDISYIGFVLQEKEKKEKEAPKSKTLRPEPKTRRKAS
ncbi:SDH family Clp fold serine proteinase, partial [Xanthovirga aplysinae]|uniref:SDH family Clp fold serine proteinase n=1 Tax=Xanthovirga aplysinae TaxID=2529853 RepID=UPI003CCDF221